MATARSMTTRWTWAEPACVSSTVRASMRNGAATSAATVVTRRTTTETVSTAEMESKASRSDLLASRSTKTGMKVAERTPPSTTS